MADIGELVLTSIVGTFFGGFGGIASSAVFERLKNQALLLQVELFRLEQFEDALLAVFDIPATPERDAQIRNINMIRRRLGTNIRARVVSSDAYALCETELVRLTNFIAAAEDGAASTQELETDIQQSVLNLRRALTRSSRNSKAFALIHG